MGGVDTLYRVSFQTNCYAWVPQGYSSLYPGVGYSLDYALRDLARIGYDGAEVDCAHILDTRLWTLTERERATLKDSVEGLGIGLEAFSAHDWPLSGASFTSQDEASSRLGLEWTKGIIDLAADLGAGVVTDHVSSPRVKAVDLLPGMPIGSFRGSIPAFGLPSDLTGGERGLMVQRVGECSDYCKSRGVLFAIEEYSPWSFWRDFIREVGSPALKVNLHAAQAWRETLRTKGYVEESSLPDAIREIGTLLAHTHCMDYRSVSALPPLTTRGSSPTVEVVPGSGECDYMAFVRALQEIGYEGYLTVECHRSDAQPGILAAQALRNMRRIVTLASTSQPAG